MKFVCSIVLCVLVSLFTGAAANTGSWQELPVIPRVKGKTLERFERDLRRSELSGMRAKVFAKVGDSNTEMASALYGFGCSEPRYGRYKNLKPVVARYKRVRLPNLQPMEGCQPWNSFTRRSAAVRSGSLSNWATSLVADLPVAGHGSAPMGCDPDETPIACEIRISRPRFVLIMTGTNDVTFDTVFEVPPGTLGRTSLPELVRAVRQLGSVPVLSTLPPNLVPASTPATVYPYNQLIARVAARTGTPLINLWRALTRPKMHNSGMDSGGLHLGRHDELDSQILLPGPTTYLDSVDLRPAALRYGSNQRNLVWLRTLERLDAVAGALKRRRGR